jgi:hypothetical protein
MVLVEALLLVREVEMQIIDMPHIFGQCILHLLLLFTSRIARKKLSLL